jgi:Zn-finger nucleic acid-binding protein
MNCPNCGGGMKPVGNRPYFRCPYCETFHYPHELADGVAVAGGEAPRNCPVCAGKLANAAIDGHAVEYCKACRGFLARNATFNQIVQLKRARNGGAPPVAIPFDREELRRRVKCPGCRKPMDTHPYHGGGNAVIDTCDRCCVVWLDAGEITVLGNYPAKASPAPSYIAPAQLVPENEPSVIHIFGFPITLGD